MTVYRRELYDYAECVNLGVLLQGRFPELDQVLERVVTDLRVRWQKSDGSFRARKLLVGWDNVPMHRWAQSQAFRSLSQLVFHQSKTAARTATTSSPVTGISRLPAEELN